MSNKLATTITIYADAVATHEPFTGIQIVAVKLEEDEIVWCEEDEEPDFFGVYGLSEKDGLHYCIADALTLQDATDLFNTLDTFARFTLTYENKNC